MLNLLVRDQPEVGEQLVELGAELRRAQQELSGPELRQLAGQRQQLVGAMVRSARRIAAGQGHRVSQATAYELEQTLHAALADPDVAAEIAAGRLSRAESRTGFDATPPEPTAPPVRRLRVVRDPDGDGERAESPAAARERQRLEQERERLRAESADAERARAEAEETLSAAKDELAEAERERTAAADAVEEVRARLAEAEDAERDAVRAERDAQRARDTAARRRDSTRKAGDLADRLADLD